MILCPRCEKNCGGKCERVRLPSRRHFFFGLFGAAVAAKAAVDAEIQYNQPLGAFYYNTETSILSVWTSNEWVPLVLGGAATRTIFSVDENTPL